MESKEKRVFECVFKPYKTAIKTQFEIYEEDLPMLIQHLSKALNHIECAKMRRTS